MEAPDKIYLTSTPYRILDRWCDSKTPHSEGMEQIEYIRKDTLMGWLESKVYEHNEDRFDDGFNTALGQVIDKLNSLDEQEQPESSKGKFVFPNFLYARTVDNKTIDVSYAPQSMDAVEYIKNDSTEQPEVDYNEFEKLFDDFCERNKEHHITSHDACMWFWELGLIKEFRLIYNYRREND